jgi:Tfp pilus assembly protein PilN
MFDTVIKQRPRHLLAVYVEPARVEILWAQRQWRSWQTGPTEQYIVPEGESPYDYLQRLNLRSKGKQTALVLFLSRSYYSFHRECYPSAIGEQLEETLTFDWAENVFYENGQMLHFHGSPVPAGSQLIVPVFSIHNSVYDKFYQCLDGDSFQTFTVIPSAQAYKSFLPAIGGAGNGSPTIEIAGRQIDPFSLEINRFYDGLLQDSVIIRKDEDTPKLFFESSQCLKDDDSPDRVHIRMLCSKDEAVTDYCEEWKRRHLPVQIDEKAEHVLSYWTRSLLGEEKSQGFGAPVYAKPWSVPKSFWVVICLILFYSVFAAYKTHEKKLLAQSLEQLQSRRARLEAQWKPIDQLQQRIPQLQEAQKALAQFGQESYPVMGLLTMLSTVTPDDTWLNFFSLKGKELTLRGESKSAIKYLGELSKLQGFQDVRFASPVSRNPASDMERFHIQSQVDVEKLKHAIHIPADDQGKSLTGIREGDVIAFHFESRDDYRSYVEDMQNRRAANQPDPRVMQKD